MHSIAHVEPEHYRLAVTLMVSVLHSRPRVAGPPPFTGGDPPHARCKQNRVRPSSSYAALEVSGLGREQGGRTVQQP